MDRKNKTFGDLTLIEKKRINNRTFWNCLCSCGNYKIIREDGIVAGSVTTCGNSIHRKKVRGLKNNHSNWKGYEDLYSNDISDIIRRAKKNNLDFSITLEIMWEQLKSQNFKCAISGLDLKLSSHSADHSKTASLDRIDSSMGYTPDNIQWIHKDVNRMKNNFNQSYFIKMCSLVADNN